MRTLSGGVIRLNIPGRYMAGNGRRTSPGLGVTSALA
jgi:hypothetical protein